MGKLVGPGLLAGHPGLGEPGQAGAHDQPLPVLRDIGAELLEERGPDRAGADDAHVALQDVDELGQLVELGRAQDPADPGHLGLGPARQLGHQERAEPVLRVRCERAELVHREDLARATDSLAAVEHGLAGRNAHSKGDRRKKGQSRRERRARDAAVERAQHHVHVARGELLPGEPRIALGERLGRGRLHRGR